MKPTSTYIRNVLIFLLCAWIVLSLLGLSSNWFRAALNLPEQYFFTEKAKPELLQLLLMPEDFPVEFRWYRQMVSGSEWAAISILGGYYNYQKVAILYEVREYYESPTWNSGGEIKFWGEPDALNNVHDLRKTGSADFQEVDCALKMDDTITCSMAIVSADNVFDLQINYEEPGDIEGMVAILNQIIGIIEGKMEQN